MLGKICCIFGTLTVLLCCTFGCSSEKNVLITDKNSLAERTERITTANGEVSLEVFEVSELTYFNEELTSSNTLIEEISNKKNKNKLEELTAYEYTEFESVVFPKVYNAFKYSSDARFTHIKTYNKYFPIEWIQAIDDEHICVIYRLRKETDIIYAYMVFQREECTNSYSEEWMNYGDYYFIRERLGLKDFLDIKTGDCILDHPLVYDTVLLNTSQCYFNESEPDVIKRYSVCMLEDGLIVLELKISKLESNINTTQTLEGYTITSLSFFPYGQDVQSEPKYLLLIDNYIPVIPNV